MNDCDRTRREIDGSIAEFEDSGDDIVASPMHFLCASRRTTSNPVQPDRTHHHPHFPRVIRDMSQNVTQKFNEPNSTRNRLKYFTMRTSAGISLDPQTLLSAYAQGVFPMADRDGVIRWFTADPRGILPLEKFHIPHTLAQVVKQDKFDVRFDHDFPATMRGCMTARPDETWINQKLIDAYIRLHQLGFAHSVECWHKDQLVGGLYGVSLGGAFFGESMFHTMTNASKVALVHLVDRLRQRKFALLDTQATTPHLKRFGCIEIPARDYERRLRQALALSCRFD